LRNINIAGTPLARRAITPKENFMPRLYKQILGLTAAALTAVALNACGSPDSVCDARGCHDPAPGAEPVPMPGQDSPLDKPLN
jgi:hypothetical protein